MFSRENLSKKRRGGKTGSGVVKNTYTLSPQHNLNVGRWWYNSGFNSGFTTLDENGNVVVGIRKHHYDDTTGYIHKNNGFMSVVGGSTLDYMLKTSYTWELVGTYSTTDKNGVVKTSGLSSDELEKLDTEKLDENDYVVFTLEPRRDYFIGKDETVGTDNVEND